MRELVNILLIRLQFGLAGAPVLLKRGSPKPGAPAVSLAFFISIVLLTLSPNAFANDPADHGFRLVSFEPSIEAPAFSLKDLAGDSVRLEQFHGQHIVLNFWATWCAPCVREMPSLQRVQQHFRHRRFRVVAISLDEESEEKVAEFAAKLNLSFPILLDPKGSVSGPYGASALPATFVLNPNGKVIAAAKGERDWYSDEAIAYLNELLRTQIYVPEAH